MGWTWTRRTWVALLLLPLLIAGVVPARPAGANPVRSGHVLTGSSTFTASATSKTLVRFPHQVDHQDLQVSWKGAGRVRGFILRKLGSYEQEGFRPVMQGVSAGRCKKRGCAGQGDFRFVVCFCGKDDLVGGWELYVIADGAPVEVTIRIKGVAGRDDVAVTHRVPTDIRTLRPRVDDGATHSLVSAGDYADLDDVDFGLVGIWVDGDPHAASAIGDCNYYDFSEFGYPSLLPPEEVAFLPGCPTGDGFVFPSVDTDGGAGGAFLTSSGFGKQVGVGGWYQTASVVKDYGAVALWIDF